MRSTPTISRRTTASTGAAGLLVPRLALVAIAISVVWLAGGQALAQSVDEARQRLDRSKQALETSRHEQSQIQADVKSIGEAYERLREQSVEKARSIQDSEARLTESESRLADLRKQEESIRANLSRSHGSIAGLMAALQRMGRNPPPVLITRRQDALAMVRSAMLLAATYPELRAQAMVLNSRLAELVKVMDDTTAEGIRYRAEVGRYRDEQNQLANLMERQKAALLERQGQLQEIGRAVVARSRDVASINDLIGRIERTIADQTRLGQYERELAVSEAQRAGPATDAGTARGGVPAEQQPGSSVGGGSPVVTAPADGRGAGAVPSTAASPAAATEVAELRPSITVAPGDRVAMVSPGRIQPAVPFNQARGTLPMPVQGRQLINFGDRTQTGPSQGVVLETRHGAQVTSPCDGWVLYAGEFRSYGKILIINGGGGYHILLAGLNLIDVQVGQFVLAGEPVGTMALKPPNDDAEKRPVLYVEFRKDQQPINPGPWWTQNQRKVQG